MQILVGYDNINPGVTDRHSMTWAVGYDPASQYVDIGTDAPDGEFPVIVAGNWAWGLTVINGAFVVVDTLEAVQAAVERSDLFNECRRLIDLQYDQHDQIFYATVDYNQNQLTAAQRANRLATKQTKHLKDL